MFNENLRLVFQYVLLIIYILLFFLQIVLFIHFIKRKNKYWIYLAGTALISCMAAIILMFFYDSLPGYGSMPGLTYFAEWFYSFCASIVFAGMLILSIASRIILTFITRIKQRTHS